jgi:hypothetical protein
MFNVDLLAGEGASFKGGRKYVHGSDIVTSLDNFAVKKCSDFFLEKIEFHVPLVTVGVILTGDTSAVSDKVQISASGILNAPHLKSELSFRIFPSPLKITNDKRAFDEIMLVQQATISDDYKIISSAYQKNFSTVEHLSSLMKVMCKMLFPIYQNWWFVRLRKHAYLPIVSENIELRVRRIIAQRLVSADILVNEQSYGEIDFIGALK